MLSKGLVTSSVARTKPYLLTGWFPLREQFIYHVPKFPHMLEYITILLINYMLGGSISYLYHSKLTFRSRALKSWYGNQVMLLITTVSCGTSKSNSGQIAYKYNLPPTINTLNYEMCRYIMILIPHQQSLVPPSHAIRTPTFDDKQHGGYSHYTYLEQ